MELQFFSYGLTAGNIYEWAGSENVALTLYDDEFNILTKRSAGIPLIWRADREHRVYVHVSETEGEPTFRLANKVIDPVETGIPTVSAASKFVGAFDSAKDVDLFFVDVGERDGTFA